MVRRLALLLVGLVAITTAVMFLLLPVEGTLGAGSLACGTPFGGGNALYEDVCSAARLERWSYMLPLVLVGAVATTLGGGRRRI